MDLFAQLDHQQATEKTFVDVAVRFRTRFHKDVIYKHLSVNPSLSQADIVAAVGLDTSEGYLPKPWPPKPLNDSQSALEASLMKMAARMNFGVNLPKTEAIAIAGTIAERFPGQISIPMSSTSVISCEVSVTTDGAIAISIAYPETPLSTSDPEDNTLSYTNRYVKSMIYLAIWQHLEAM